MGAAQIVGAVRPPLGIADTVHREIATLPPRWLRRFSLLGTPSDKTSPIPLKRILRLLQKRKETHPLHPLNNPPQRKQLEKPSQIALRRSLRRRRRRPHHLRRLRPHQRLAQVSD